MFEHFYYHPRMLHYDFGPRHPLKPDRLMRAIELLERLGLEEPIDPGEGDVADVHRVHDPAYATAVDLLGTGLYTPNGFRERAGFGNLDNPVFPGMHEAALAYVAGSAAAARAVVAGAKRAYNLSGGLHHALKNRASGFCIYNDPAIALHILLERFRRVAYVDIDVHHGDGVQWIFYDDERVLNCSIHEDGRTLFPGSGTIHENGASYTCFNVPLQAKTSGDVWLWAFQNAIVPALERFAPQAIVLQMGADPHYLDPLGHIRVAVQHWLGAVREIHRLCLPVVAVGGGGYNLSTVPRMWAAACLVLEGHEPPMELPPDLGQAWGAATFLDVDPPIDPLAGKEQAQLVVAEILTHVIHQIPVP